MKKVYFGHPINIYGTTTEGLLIKAIERGFPDWEVENPNQPYHGEGYQRFKAENGNGMLYFYEEVLPQMDAGVFLAFEDGMFGAGVYKEAQFLVDNGKNIFEIDLEGGLTGLVLNESRKLSVEDTRARVYPVKKD